MVQTAWASRLEVQCPVGTSLNSCVAQACANPDGGNVYLGAGIYDANLTSALNLKGFWGDPDFIKIEPLGSCQGGVSIIGQGTGKTILISNGPNPLTITLMPEPGETGPAIEFQVNWPYALGIGNEFGKLEIENTGNIDGPSEIRDLTVRCEAGPDACPRAGVAINGDLTSGVIRNLRVEGFRRGIQLTANNGVVENNTLIGLGPEEDDGGQLRNFGRGIYISYQQSDQGFSNITVSNNTASNFHRGMTMGVTTNFVVTQNTFVDSVEGILVQGNFGPYEVSYNKIGASRWGIASNLNNYFEDDDGQQIFPEEGVEPGLYYHNLLGGHGIGFRIQLDFDVTFSQNVMIGTPEDQAILFEETDPIE